MSTNRERSCLTIILAAGEGKRMASSKPKVLHPIAGLPMVLHVLNTAIAAGSTSRAVVIGNQADIVQDVVERHDPLATVHLQSERLGTAHAALCARGAMVDKPDDVVILNGDGPLVQPDTIRKARESLADNDVSVVGFRTADPTGYGRLLMQDGQLVAIREQKDATDEEKSITFCNSGIISISGKHFLSILEAVGKNNVQGEYYLTDVVEVARDQGLSVGAVEVDEEETLGINDRVQLARAEAIWQDRRRQAAMISGVTLAHPETVVFHHDTIVEPDATVEPNVVFGPGVCVAGGATIRAFSHLEGARVEAGAVIGPYARLRPGTIVAEGAKIGNFVETKNTHLGAGAKINHLSYVGDAQVGAKANIGAGTITCNYDGFNKHRTDIGAGAFIGSNTALVAPVRVGVDANTAAGSVIVEDVPDDALALARGRQTNKEGRAKTVRAALKAQKESAGKG